MPMKIEMRSELKRNSNNDDDINYVIGIAEGDENNY